MKSSLPLLFALIFTIQAHAQDFEAPEITSISATLSVDVTSHAQTITATVQITDDEGGYDFGNLFVYRPDGTFVSSHGMGPTKLFRSRRMPSSQL